MVEVVRTVEQPTFPQLPLSQTEMSSTMENEQTTPVEKVDNEQPPPRTIKMVRDSQKDMFYVPKKCPGLRNSRRSNGKIVHPQAYAIPLTNPDIVFFLRKYSPVFLPEDADFYDSYRMFLHRFPGRPKELETIAHLLVPIKSGGIWEPLGVVIAHNLTQEGLDRMAHADELMKEVQKIFEFEREPGWYCFV
ncbi:hypothetical protein CVT24_002580 [Panaeolus cyanescens]|uniref:Uncharacterized protein n=1 Tax=Panaeolus cyanescens TaxID=181874 RepID=A0A409WB55_9AGAR|nr:hypothetical protein CVT24_002580 [Panaeolus cyanescens]